MSNNLKPKEPLLALWLSIIFQGLGQLYAGQLKKGVIFAFIELVEIIAGFLILRDLVKNPASIIYPIHFVILGVGSVFRIYVVIDAYLSAKAFNKKNQLECKQTPKKWVFFIVGYIAVSILIDRVAYIIDNYVQSFRIPAVSMSPTLMIGDKLFVDKSIYKHSEPKRGDVIVFKYPVDKNKIFLKRLVAFPGESVEIKDGKVLVDGKVLDDQETFGRFYYHNHDPYGTAKEAVKVPINSYYVLGDNSANSTDSRFWGFVPKEDLIGKATKIWWPIKRTAAVK